jgi:hypothetical protein
VSTARRAFELLAAGLSTVGMGSAAEGAGLLRSLLNLSKRFIISSVTASW